MRKKLYFKRTESGEWDWFIADLGWGLPDIESIEGVSLLFDRCCDETVVYAEMEYSLEPFPGSGELILLSVEAGYHGVYWLPEYNGEKMNQRVDIVFSVRLSRPCVPERLYVDFYPDPKSTVKEKFMLR